jgi:type I restriction enzyme, S subunit
MKSNYKRLGDYIQEIKNKNIELKVKKLLGINIDKFFMPSVANIIGTDMSVYKIVKKNQFSCNRMHVGRDYRLPISMSTTDGEFIVSPAYDVFEIIDTKILDPDYLMMWFNRQEFDRNAWFYTDADVRGGLHWKAFCDMQLPVPHIDTQRQIVAEYNVIQNRIALNQQLIQKLEDTAQTIYKQWFVDFEFPDDNGKPYLSNGGAMVWNETLQKEIPLGWEVLSIGSYSKVKSGFAFKSELWQKTGCPVIKIGSISNNTIDCNSLDFINPNNIEIAKNYKVQQGDIVIAMTGATIGKIGLVPELNSTVLVNQRVGIFNLGKNPIEKTAFLYFNLLSNFVQNEINNVGGDSAQANISNSQIDNIKILFPTNKIINSFNMLCKPIIKMILNQIKSNQLSYKLNILQLSKLATI